jgi:hypothetical protein
MQDDAKKKLQITYYNSISYNYGKRANDRVVFLLVADADNLDHDKKDTGRFIKNI